MEPIGGYFELEICRHHTNEYHDSAVALNSGRNALRYILKERNVHHIYLPYYICQSVLEPIKEMGIDYGFYRIDANLEIKKLKDLDPTSHLLYVNYFGLKGRYVKKLARGEFAQLIVDNSQAFYDNPFEGADTFYSPRKFFGVPGGGYVYGPSKGRSNLKNDISHNRSEHLLMRYDRGAEAGYEAYQENERRMAGRPLRRMSSLTKKILTSLHYEEIRKKRNANYQTLHKALGKKNELIDLASFPYKCPLIYPFKNNAVSRNQLLKHKIYVARYWPNVDLTHLKKNTIEHVLTNDMIALPVDQRYSEEEMLKIVEVIKQYG